MVKHNPKNERLKRKFFTYLKEAKQQSEASLDASAKALSRFEDYTRLKDFGAFHTEQAIAFKKHLADQESKATGEKLSKATLHTTLAHLKRFFQWLSEWPGCKTRFRRADADYFNLSSKETRVANARRSKSFPTLEQVKHVIALMPHGTEIERRNRVVVAFTILTGARDSATASIKLKHIDTTAGSVFQDARDVKTKFSKSFTTYFFPVGDDIQQIVLDWVQYLRKENLWGNDDPLFPATAIITGASRHFEVSGLKRDHWSNASPIRKIFQDAFQAAGLPYFNPHSLRNTLVHLGQIICRTPEEFKAWSQNLGHEGVMTTFFSYGEVGDSRQGEIIRDLAKPQQVEKPDMTAFLKGIERLAVQSGLGKVN